MSLSYCKSGIRTFFRKDFNIYEYYILHIIKLRKNYILALELTSISSITIQNVAEKN